MRLMIDKVIWASRLTLLLAFALLLAGCKSEEEELYQRVHKASYKEAYAKAFSEGVARGRKQGAEEGAAAARKAAATGVAWQLYRALALGALATGLMLGLLIQYSLLLICRRTGRLPQFSTVAFVPAMKSTVVYEVFKRRRDVMIEIEERLSEMAARKNLQVAKIEQLKEAIDLKIRAISSIEQLSQARLLELAAEELEKIVSDSEKKAKAAMNGQGSARQTTKNDEGSGQPTTRITHVCPHCERLVRFSLRSANGAVTCPYPNCGQPIRLPPAFSGTNGEPFILDVDD